jgi:hypothetical protein
MKSCWGISNALPETFIQQLPRNTAYSFAGHNVYSDVVIALTVEQLAAHYHKLKKLEVVVFVFDVYPHLRSWRIPVVPCTKEEISRVRKLANNVSYHRTDPIQKLLDESTGSFVSSFMTMVYKVKDTPRQIEIKDTVFMALYDNRIDGLSNQLTKAASDLRTLITSDDARRLAAALTEYREANGKKSVSQVATKHSVSKFDINYLLKYITRLTDRRNANTY